ncbi:cytochrome b [Acidocella sp. KAb 2-4]|uniref:cytochrome b n=1 Tax=Acidocella sp. KAb 2-4 TaxID=2885158 RepID=UPI001D08C467|nr:cytochrome b/b6 domain-containing protein [Acidocella sp. KAb 2-4]MCB5944640.1 cytochrome b/b6 domain-containing protein [Acidocella sp. KAb 2-4]
MTMMKITPSAASLSATRHDGLTIALHWLTAALVVLQFLLAETWDFFPKPARHLMIVGHISFGLVLAAVFGARLLWRATPGRRHFNDGPDLASRAARLMHRLLYLLLGAEIILGVFTRWTDNHPLTLFGLLIPSPFGTFSKVTGEWVDQIHDITAWSIIILAGAHAAMALVHHYLMRDDVLRRMMPGR